MVRLTTAKGQTSASPRVRSLRSRRNWSLSLLSVFALLLSSTSARLDAAELVDSVRYIVGPGDIFTVSFSEAQILPFHTEVGVEGAATIDGVGTFSLTGLTLTEARAKLLSGLKKRFSGSGVELHLTTVRQKRTLVAGAVEKPGLYDSKATALVSDLIAKAGGLSAGASRRNIEIRAEGADSYAVDLEKFSLVGDPESNPAVYLGDVIFVPLFTDSTRRLYVSGEVRSPGWIEYTGRDAVMDLVRLAGGLTGGARADSVLLFESASADGGGRSMLGVSEIKSILPGSRVIALSAGEKAIEKDVSISGAITNPGRYPYADGMSIESLIALAGGTLSEAYPAGITLFNPSHDNEALALFLVRTENTSMANSNSFAPSGPMSAVNVRSGISGDLAPGDSVIVPFAEGFVSVLGQVKFPGLVSFASERSALEYVGLAGGVNSWADLNSSYVTRKIARGATPLKLADIIYDGDIIFVTRKRDTRSSGTLRWLRDVTLIGAGVALTVFTIDEIGN
jgi:protein involved in polysaccharide export with SLBB domain